MCNWKVRNVGDWGGFISPRILTCVNQSWWLRDKDAFSGPDPLVSLAVGEGRLPTDSLLGREGGSTTAASLGRATGWVVHPGHWARGSRASCAEWPPVHRDMPCMGGQQAACAHWGPGLSGVSTVRSQAVSTCSHLLRGYCVNTPVALGGSQVGRRMSPRVQHVVLPFPGLCAELRLVCGCGAA